MKKLSSIFLALMMMVMSSAMSFATVEATVSKTQTNTSLFSGNNWIYLVIGLLVLILIGVMIGNSKRG